MLQVLIEKSEARAMLPQVGDRLWRVPSYLKRDAKEEIQKRRCVVVQVNRSHLWYLVRYFHDGMYECFKVLPQREEEETA